MAKKYSLEAYNRLFVNVFVCKNCNSKIRARIEHVLAGKVKCRKCKSKALRPKRIPK